jgi:hypothetical protein
MINHLIVKIFKDLRVENNEEDPLLYWAVVIVHYQSPSPQLD